MLILLLKLGVVAYGLLLLAVFLFQSKLIWFPGGPPLTTPAALGLAYEDVELVTQDGERLHAWLVKSPAPRGLVLFCHGNAGSIEHRLGAARALVGMGVSVLLFDYRGYGGSSGSPSEAGTYRDAEAAWKYATTATGAGFAPEQVVVWGESLGGAVAIELARTRAAGALVTEAAFTTLGDAAAHHYGWLPARALLRARYDNLGKVGQDSFAQRPWLLLHSPEDEVVPFAQAERLLAAARGPATLVRTRGGHNDGGFLLEPETIAAVRAFLERAIPPRPPK